MRHKPELVAMVIYAKKLPLCIPISPELATMQKSAHMYPRIQMYWYYLSYFLEETLKFYTYNLIQKDDLHF